VGGLVTSPVISGGWCHPKVPSFSPIFVSELECHGTSAYAHPTIATAHPDEDI
jgi:hypothetical protein